MSENSSTSSSELPLLAFTEGDVLTAEGKGFTLTKYLGQGSTAIVWGAKEDSTDKIVALKFLRQDAGPIATERFWIEVAILQQFSQREVKQVPKVEAVQKDNFPKFIVMEVVDPVEYPAITNLIEDNGPLAEGDALIFAEQAFKILEIFHLEIKRTYTDMQLKNFCWNSSKKELMVMDWGHVSPTEIDLDSGLASGNAEFSRILRGRGANSFSDLVNLDLSRMGSYFYTVLTGKGASERGETEWRLEHRASERWNSISLATKKILYRLLVPSASQGLLVSASEVLELIKQSRELSSNDDSMDLQDKFEKLLDDAAIAPFEPENIKKQYEAEIYLDRLKKLSVDDASLARYCMIQAKKFMGLDDKQDPVFKKGRSYYDAGSFAEAQKIWDELANVKGKIEYMRWSLVAQVCSDASQSASQETLARLRTNLENGVALLREDELAEAKLFLKNAYGTVEAPITRWFIEEIEALEILEKLSPDFLLANPEMAAKNIREIIGKDFIDQTQYSRFFLYDDLWYRRLAKTVPISNLDEMRRLANSNIKLVLFARADNLESTAKRQNLNSNIISELSDPASSFDHRCEKLRLALLDFPADQEIIKLGMEFAKEKSNSSEKFQILEILTSFAVISKEQASAIKKVKVDNFLSDFAKNIEGGNDSCSRSYLLQAYKRLEEARHLAYRLDVMKQPGSDKRNEDLTNLATKIGSAEKIQMETRRAINSFTQNTTVEILFRNVSLQIDKIEKEYGDFPSSYFRVVELRDDLEKIIRPGMTQIAIEMNALGTKDFSQVFQLYQNRVDRLGNRLDMLTQDLMKHFENASEHFKNYQKKSNSHDLEVARNEIEEVKKRWREINQ
jgi:hypothetical protein